MGYIWDFLLDRGGKSFSQAETLCLYTFSFFISCLNAYIFTLIKQIINPKRKILYKVFLCVGYTFITLPVANVIGVRSSNVGYDTSNYILSYFRSNSNKINVFEKSTEVCFYILQKISYYLFEGHKLGAIYPISFLTVFFMTLGLDLWNKKKALPFGLFLFYMYFGQNMTDQSRQLLAMAILCVAFYYFHNFKNKSFFFLVLFAATFHMTALICFVLYIFRFVSFNKVRNRIFYWFIVLFLSYILFYKIDVLLGYLVSSKYYYLMIMLIEKQRPGIRLITDTAPFFVSLFILNFKGHYKQWGENKIGYFTLPFRLGAYRTYFIYRLMYYPAIFSIITISTEIENLYQTNVKLKKILIIFLFLFYFIFDFYLNTHMAVPYQLMQ